MSVENDFSYFYYSLGYIAYIRILIWFNHIIIIKDKKDVNE